MTTAPIVTIQALLASPGVTAIVGQDINPDTGTAKLPSIAVNSVTDNPLQKLSGPTRTYQGRVSVLSRARDADTLHNLALATRAALSGRVGIFAGCQCRFWKAGTDYTRWADDSSLCERITDWFVFYVAPADG